MRPVRLILSGVAALLLGSQASSAPSNLHVLRFAALHRNFVNIAHSGRVELLFVGDSITGGWRHPRRGLPVWKAYFAPLKAANFGIAGDTTEGVLWRMRNGELDGLKARLIVLMVGVNNIGHQTNAEIADADRLIVEEIRRRQPQAKILLLGVLPRGADPADPFRASVRQINERLALLADGRQVFYADIGDKFLEPDGTLPAEVMDEDRKSVV